ncbi:MAG TPA: NfeD family protein [Saprospiraceae bacterium]|nr:NfeD family protein [Saprospiraceae bacterium]HNT20358.1 NfeD family protein [Saprospiraceae bacterium]
MILIMLEISVPGGFIMLFFGLGALTLSVLTFFIDMGWMFQIALFLVSSLMYLFLLRENAQRFLNPQIKEDPENEFIGKTAKALTPISDMEGKVEFKGTQWTALSKEPIPPGTEVEIVGQESITLFVKPIN